MRTLVAQAAGVQVEQTPPARLSSRLRMLRIHSGPGSWLGGRVLVVEVSCYDIAALLPVHAASIPDILLQEVLFEGNLHQVQVVVLIIAVPETDSC